MMLAFEGFLPISQTSDKGLFSQFYIQSHFMIEAAYVNKNINKKVA